MSAPASIEPAPPARRGFRRHPLLASRSGAIGLAVLALMLFACFATIPWTFGTVEGSPRYDLQDGSARLMAPSWLGAPEAPVAAADPAPAAPRSSAMGTDLLGRDLLVRVLAGGAISLLVGIAAAAVSVSVGTAYGLIAGYLGGRTDAAMMRIVDVLYGLPNVLLVVLLAVASDALIEEYVSRGKARQEWVRHEIALVAAQRGEPVDRTGIDRLMARDPDLLAGIQAQADKKPELRPRELSAPARRAFDLLTLLLAIGGVSWLTMARVVRGQVLSLKSQPFIEAARALGAPAWRIALRHLLPNLVGPIVVYATLTVPQAILQESFLSFLGIGVKPPLPSWGNLAAEGLSAINPVRVRWWLAVFPCGALALTLLALNFVGEGLREALDPKRSARR